MTLRRGRMWDPHHRVPERPVLVLGCHLERWSGSLVLHRVLSQSPPQRAQPYLVMVPLGATLWSSWFCFSSFLSSERLLLSVLPRYSSFSDGLSMTLERPGPPWIFTVSSSSAQPPSFLFTHPEAKCCTGHDEVCICVWSQGWHSQDGCTIYQQDLSPLRNSKEWRHGTKTDPNVYLADSSQLFLLSLLFREATGQRWFHTGKSPFVHFLICPEIPDSSIVILLLWGERCPCQQMGQEWSQGVEGTVSNMSSQMLFSHTVIISDPRLEHTVTWHLDKEDQTKHTPQRQEPHKALRFWEVRVSCEIHKGKVDEWTTVPTSLLSGGGKTFAWFVFIPVLWLH